MKYYSVTGLICCLFWSCANGPSQSVIAKEKKIMMKEILSNKNEDCEVKIELTALDKINTECIIHIKNNSPNALYFFNRIYLDTIEGGLLNVDKNILYSYEHNDEILILAKAIIPVPENKLVEKNVIPGCTKILPFMEFEETLNISKPIAYHHPYETDMPFTKVSFPVKFRFGYFAGHEQTESMEIKIPAKEGEVIFFDPFDDNYQKIIEVGMFKPLLVEQEKY